MTSEKKVCKITIMAPKAFSSEITESLSSFGITNFHIAAARLLTLQEKKGFFSFSQGLSVAEDPAVIISLLVNPDAEDSVLDYIIKSGDLTTPGRGTVYSEEINLFKAHELCKENNLSDFKKGKADLNTELIGICCIVQRGEGNRIARVALDTGTCVPFITFGDGTGVRDKLGILRITIPAEKEVVNLVASLHDADTVMEMMINAGQLNLPGKGFIFLYPIRKGIVNTKITRGMEKHAASMEQIISTLDEIKGGTGWRRRTGASALDSKKKRTFLENLIALTFICNEGRGEDLIKTAMSVGAAGATISKLKHQCPPDSEASKISPAREMCNMIVSEQQVNNIVNAMEKDGAFDDNTHGMFQLSPVPKAFTYLGK